MIDEPALKLEFDADQEVVQRGFHPGERISGRIYNPAIQQVRIRIDLEEEILVAGETERQVIAEVFLDLEAEAWSPFQMFLPQALETYRGRQLKVSYRLLLQQLSETTLPVLQYPVLIQDGSRARYAEMFDLEMGPSSHSTQIDGVHLGQTEQKKGLIEDIKGWWRQHEPVTFITGRVDLSLSVSERVVSRGEQFLGEVRISASRDGHIVQAFLDIQCQEVVDNNFDRAPIYQKRYVLGDGIDYQNGHPVVLRQQILIPKRAPMSLVKSSGRVQWMCFADIRLSSGRELRAMQEIVVVPSEASDD